MEPFIRYDLYSTAAYFPDVTLHYLYFLLSLQKDYSRGKKIVQNVTTK